MRDARMVTAVLMSFWVVSAARIPAARAGEVCGDVDETGGVTVTDGVQVLRGAAGLSGVCAAESLRCDVDDDGVVSVTDGVVVLRLAAGLPATADCGAAEVATTVEALTPLLARVLPALAATEPSTTAPCATSGTVAAVISGAIVTTTFSACVAPIGGDDVQLDGSVVRSFNGADFTVTARDLTTGVAHGYSGTVTRVTGLPDGGLELDHPGLAMTIADGAPTATLTFDHLTVAGTGRLQSGSVVIGDPNGGFDFATITVTVESASNASVHEIPDDGNGADFALDLASGRLTRARH